MQATLEKENGPADKLGSVFGNAYEGETPKADASESPASATVYVLHPRNG
jgi:hypothetical protein